LGILDMQDMALQYLIRLFLPQEKLYQKKLLKGESSVIFISRKRFSFPKRKGFI
jgi:hypothetical protein